MFNIIKKVFICSLFIFSVLSAELPCQVFIPMEASQSTALAKSDAPISFSSVSERAPFSDISIVEQCTENFLYVSTWLFQINTNPYKEIPFALFSYDVVNPAFDTDWANFVWTNHSLGNEVIPLDILVEIFYFYAGTHQIDMLNPYVPVTLDYKPLEMNKYILTAELIRCCKPKFDRATSKLYEPNPQLLHRLNFPNKQSHTEFLVWFQGKASTTLASRGIFEYLDPSAELIKSETTKRTHSDSHTTSHTAGFCRGLRRPSVAHPAI